MSTNVVKVISTISYDDAITKAKLQYGNDIKVISSRTVEKLGVLGLGSKRSFEVDVWLNPPTKSVVTPSPSDIIKAAELVKDEKRDEVLGEITKQLADIQQKLSEDEKRNKREKTRKEELSGELGRIKAVLRQENDFSDKFADELINSVKNDLSLTEAEDGDYVEELVLKELRSKMSFYKSTLRAKPRIFILVGPTGVGKTTTIVKLAAINADDHKVNRDGKVAIRFINMDNFKIGANEQLNTYAKILHTSAIWVNDFEDLNKAIDETREADVVFVDTSGSSPFAVVTLANLSEALTKFGLQKDVYLCISASTKESDVAEILSMFKVLNYKAIILTKLDETKRIGTVLTPLIEKREAIAYITTGQNVGISEIEAASIVPIWRKLSGFNKRVVDKIIRQLDEENDYI
ncbi:MAG: hypothetical protein FWE37_06850 [Spirochaetaceae bacterium]|nr:hypothetical protein [Spirochaetaceae bacterium]